jgi:aryl-alcohol dehydrogenase-like predicted oxidoreductase
MRYVKVGGARLSAIGLGTWQFGSREWGYGRDYAQGEAGAIVERALGLGINLFDTAEVYAFGQSERILGRALAESGGTAFVATKVFPVAPIAPVVEQRGKASRKRLGVEKIDLYQVHWPNPAVPIATTMAGMRRLQQQGVIEHVGVSNFSLAQWEAAESALRSPVFSNQVQYSLVARGPERRLLPYAAENDRLIIAYSPLAQGLLSAKYDASNLPKRGVRAANALFLPENLERASGLLEALRDVAQAHGATAAQVALSWVIRRPNVVAIPGASSVAQLEANAAAGDLELTDDEDKRITDEADDFSPVQGARAVPQLLRQRLPF